MCVRERELEACLESYLNCLAACMYVEELLLSVSSREALGGNLWRFCYIASRSIRSIKSG